ncbi:helix-turn-helix domain-containing protein [Streptomyces buecherae]|uniref:helix-turn-helix domain-containing protein n=1 Tax=Streptomyces buecherae TaxID=2763006 RepID=UPI001C27E56F|nr:helix-turn-helix transcriptional regulator [Streptomyces buecherae]
MSDPTDTTETIGARVRQLRLIRDYSLQELGRQAHVSASQLCRVERGDRYPSEPVLAAVARALGVNVSVLRGQPYIQTLQRDQLDALLTPLSAAFDDWDLPPDDAPPPGPLAVLETAVQELIALRVQAEFTKLAERLPGLVTEIAIASQLQPTGHRHERAHVLQAEAARTAAIHGARDRGHAAESTPARGGAAARVRRVVWHLAAGDHHVNK